MPTDYLIKGTGGALSGDYLLGRDLKGVDASVRFENLGPDIFQWTARTESITAGETTIPTVGQQVELWDATGATRYFRGWVTQARAMNYGVQVVVEGPWQWLRKMDVTTKQTQVVETDRPSIIFAEASVTSSITSLLNRAIALGAPIAVGSIASTFTVPKLQLSMMSFADALSELIRWVPDSVGWFDYSGSGTPTFNVSRRSSMTAQTFAVGTVPLHDFDLTGRPDLVPSQVVVAFTTRGTDQRPQFAQQASGTPALGRVQTIGLSGKELDTFLPADNYESYVAQTRALNSTVNIENAIRALIPEVVKSRANFNGFPRESFNDVLVANGETLWYSTAIGSTPSYLSFPQPAYAFRDAATGAPVSLTGKNLVVGDDQPDWAADVYANAQKVKVSGRIYRTVNRTFYQVGQPAQNVYAEEPWSTAFPWTRDEPGAYYVGTSRPTITPTSAHTIFFLYLDFEIDAFLTTSTFTSPTTIYRPQDFEYLSPPANLAANLMSAQAFTPYEGTIDLRPAGAAEPDNWLRFKFNVTGAHAGLESADALPRSITYDLASSAVSIDIGAPSRFNFSTLAGRVRQTPQTNIEINS
jgi:hypothetical protein